MKTKILPFIFSFLLITQCSSPDTSVYLGNQIPKKFVEEIKTLGLLQKDEEIKYFYSDAFIDIKEGFYFVSNKKLVVYSKAWDEPKTIILFSDITKLNIDYDDSFLEDSYITIETSDGIIVEFPVSSERGRDKDFYNYLVTNSTQATETSEQ